jgi:histidinol-phosphate/aromatic aminotransferase/cobyric acid decarboxylase-like protein
MNDIHGGNIRRVAEKLQLKNIPEIKYDFSVNLNPLGPPVNLSDLMENCKFDWEDYPDPLCVDAVKHLAVAHKLSPKNLTVGNGATELFATILTAFNIKTADYLSPCYSGYKEACEKTRVNSHSIKTLEEMKSDAVFIGYPNNPTGSLISKEQILKAVSKNTKRLFIVDESFMDFVVNSDKMTFIETDLPENLIVVKSLTKMFNIAGIRLGMAVGREKNIEKINKYRLPWSVNAFAQKVATVLYLDSSHVEKTKLKVKQLRENIIQQLIKIENIEVFQSEANFIFFKSDDKELQDKLLLKGIFIRSCENIEGLEKGSYRVAVKTQHENNELIKALQF